MSIFIFQTAMHIWLHFHHSRWLLFQIQHPQWPQSLLLLPMTSVPGCICAQNWLPKQWHDATSLIAHLKSHIFRECSLTCWNPSTLEIYTPAYLFGLNFFSPSLLSFLQDNFRLHFSCKCFGEETCQCPVILRNVMHIECETQKINYNLSIYL